MTPPGNRFAGHIDVNHQTTMLQQSTYQAATQLQFIDIFLKKNLHIYNKCVIFVLYFPEKVKKDCSKNAILILYCKENKVFTN